MESCKWKKVMEDTVTRDAIRAITEHAARTQDETRSKDIMDMKEIVQQVHI